MTKKAPSKRAPVKSKERELFSVRNSSSKSKGLGKKKLKQAVDNSDDEQTTEIKKMCKISSAIKKNIKLKGKNVTYDSMVSGTVVACCVFKVFTDRILVSLPFRMKGYVPLTHISKQYTRLMQEMAHGKVTSDEAFTLPDLYHPGQFLTASVAKTQHNLSGYVGLPLSLYPSDVNGSSVSANSLQVGCVLQCTVVSTEDHGYTLDSGVRGVSAAFLPSQAAPTDVTVAVGSTLPCVVTAVRGAGMAINLTLSALPETVSAAASKPSDSKYELTVPGTCVQAVVIKSGAQGLEVLVGGEDDYYEWLENNETQGRWQRGTIGPHHLRGPFDQGHLFRAGQKVQPRILLTTNFPKTMHFTLNKNVFNYTPSADPQHGLTLGTVVPDAAALISSDAGLSLRLSDKCIGFCPLKEVAGVTKASSMAKKYRPGTKTPCKVIAFNPVDQLFIVTLDSAKIKEKPPGSEKLQPSMVLSVTITEHRPEGARVRTEAGTDGFVHRRHLTDTNMAEPHLKLPKGKKVKAMVLQIIEKKYDTKSTRQVYFTLKTALIESDLPIVTEYKECNVGLETLAVVCHKHESRLFLELFDGTRGLLNASALPAHANFDLDYQIGLVMRVKITRLLSDHRSIYHFTVPGISRPSRHPICLTEKERTSQLAQIGETNREKVGWLSKMRVTLACSNESTGKEEGSEETAQKSSSDNKSSHTKVLRRTKKLSASA